jgi:adenylosuccinate lyase
VAAAEYLGKVNGATGTYAAHVAGAPATDWQAVGRAFVEGLGLTWNPLTTQIEPHDWQAELYADIARFNRVLHNLCTDVWTYISLSYFAQVRGQGTVGSSTMPHKVNPIRFENAEANLEVSCALLDVLGSTLVTSRLQRDLTDSSMQRNVGTAFGHIAAGDRERAPRAGRARRRPGGDGAGPRRGVGGAGGGRAVRDAGARPGPAVRAAEGPDPRPPGGRRRHAEFRAGPGLPAGAAGPAAGPDPGDLHRPGLGLVDHLDG